MSMQKLRAGFGPPALWIVLAIVVGLGLVLIGPSATATAADTPPPPPAGAPPAGAPPAPGAPAPAPTTPAPGAPAPPPVAPAYKHAQPFSVITVGTASPHFDPTSASACTMIQLNGGYYPVDLGPTVQLSMMFRARPDSAGTTAFAISKIQAIFFSHLHEDHTFDYFQIMTTRWMTGGQAVTVIGPPRTGMLQDFLINFYHDDLVYRMLRRVAQQGVAVDVAAKGMFNGVTVKEITGTNVMYFKDGVPQATAEGADLKVTSSENVHTMYSLAYRFEANGKSIVVSGDTAYTYKLINIAKNADIFVLDCDSRTTGGKPMMLDYTKLPLAWQRTLPYAGNYAVAAHAQLDQCVDMVIQAKPKTVVLTHVSRPGPSAAEQATMTKAFRDAGYFGNVLFATDGMEINP
jgi:ribonuclease BN (tRNA processing enzyme)